MKLKRALVFREKSCALWKAISLLLRFGGTSYWMKVSFLYFSHNFCMSSADIPMTAIVCDDMAASNLRMTSNPFATTVTSNPGCDFWQKLHPVVVGQ